MVRTGCSMGRRHQVFQRKERAVRDFLSVVPSPSLFSKLTVRLPRKEFSAIQFHVDSECLNRQAVDDFRYEFRLTAVPIGPRFEPHGRVGRCRRG
ncbi:hypothetical protein EC9_41240 [Rosistilla ulvae]|uniref:Uncharacterized protein n=1 Tax=Rosistilla ulvae TaxID=1930277 RepID=A0A517M4X4_9BACT|nr:hypothetical protein EC9_41240 [Rosistilla ulvae]